VSAVFECESSEAEDKRALSYEPAAFERFEAVRFENVRFAYTPGTDILKDISFDAERTMSS
jgi:ABC-type transport system involved in Fe-S cluster assembly fused permease/ATPase subunit